MTEKQIAELNRRFGAALGQHEGPNGTVPHYAWKRSSELFYFMQDGTREVHSEGRLVALVVPSYQRFCWADRIGNTWVICQWKAPKPESEWRAAFGSTFDWPKNGQYYPITITAIGEGEEPDADLTQFAIYCIRKQLQKRYGNILRECQDEAKKSELDTQTEFDDRVDDWWPAFDNDPGTRGGHVSFGGV